MPTIRDHLALTAPRLRQAYAYWVNKAGARLMPSRRDIDPTEIPSLLPFVMLLDVILEPLDFRYRLVGTEVVNISHANYTGKLFSELPGKENGSSVWNSCEQVVLTKAPLSQSSPYVGPEQSLRRCENLLLPLSEDGARVNMILKVISFELRSSGAEIRAHRPAIR